MSDLKKGMAFDAKGSTTSDGIPRIRYDAYFRLFGMIPRRVEQYLKSSGSKMRGTGLMSRVYGRLISLMLWFLTLRTMALIFISDHETQIMLGDLTGFWTDDRICFLVPMAFFSLHAALIMSKWQSRGGELAWLVPYVSIRRARNSKEPIVSYNGDTVSMRYRTFTGILLSMVRISHLSRQYLSRLSLQ